MDEKKNHSLRYQAQGALTLGSYLGAIKNWVELSRRTTVIT
jgi:tryptophanyl-tRNA synthetase